MVPNSALAWLFLKQRVTGRFVAGLGGRDGRGRPAVRAGDARQPDLAPARCCSASASPCSACSPPPSPTSCRRAGGCAAWPLASLLAWGMLYGIVANALYRLGRRRPAGRRGPAGYGLGLVYLGLFASALAFILYFAVIRAIGPGKAAYSSVLVPIIAMVLLDDLRRLSLVDPRRRRRRCSRWPAWSSRCGRGRRHSRSECLERGSVRRQQRLDRLRRRSEIALPGPRA